MWLLSLFRRRRWNSFSAFLKWNKPGSYRVANAIWRPRGDLDSYLQCVEIGIFPVCTPPILLVKSKRKLPTSLWPELAEPSRAHHSYYPYIRCILKSWNSSKVSTGIGAPVTAESHYHRFKIVHICSHLRIFIFPFPLCLLLVESLRRRPIISSGISIPEMYMLMYLASAADFSGVTLARIFTLLYSSFCRTFSIYPLNFLMSNTVWVWIKSAPASTFWVRWVSWCSGSAKGFAVAPMKSRGSFPCIGSPFWNFFSSRRPLAILISWMESIFHDRLCLGIISRGDRVSS